MTSSSQVILPDFASFSSHYQQDQPQLVWTRLVVDLETPVSTMLKLMEEHSPCFLLESVVGGEVRGRYSIIGLKPDLIWRCFGNRAEISRVDRDWESHFMPCGDALTSLRQLMQESHMEIPDALPPMAAGLIGYLSYDTVRLMERIPDKNPDPVGIPDACLMRPKIMVIFDAVAGVIYICTPIWRQQERTSAEQAYRTAGERIQGIVETLNMTQVDQSLHYREQPSLSLEFTSNLTRPQYYAMVEKAKEYIAAGDIFQAVLSQRFSTPYKLPHFALYRSIRHLNPSPFMFYLHFGGFSLVGASPEILVRVRDNTVTMRPIAGTRKRGKTREEDTALAQELLADPKELAEHLMLLDLGRNDVGRISKTGTVKVTDRMIIERYSHVMHIVSNVEGELDPRYDALDALMAGFPAGTVSGAPKIRAMEIIDELEPLKRGFYAGGVGYISANGTMDTCISLRTALIKDNTLYIQAGGGVVADSSPEGEYEETLNKARALMRAAEDSVKFGGPQ